MTREEIDQRRADFLAGATFQWLLDGKPWNDTSASVEAAKRFPYPTQPRVITFDRNGGSYRVMDGELQFRLANRPVDEWGPSRLTAADVRRLADLFDHPTEEVS